MYLKFTETTKKRGLESHQNTGTATEQVELEMKGTARLLLLKIRRLPRPAHGDSLTKDLLQASPSNHQTLTLAC